MTVTKTEAVLDGTDKTFVEIAAEREKDRGRS
jgi:hypothetical protein